MIHFYWDNLIMNGKQVIQDIWLMELLCHLVQTMHTKILGCSIKLGSLICHEEIKLFLVRT